jgi:hypothetical protein
MPGGQSAGRALNQPAGTQPDQFYRSSTSLQLDSIRPAGTRSSPAPAVAGGPGAPGRVRPKASRPKASRPKASRQLCPADLAAVEAGLAGTGYGRAEGDRRVSGEVMSVSRRGLRA